MYQDPFLGSYFGVSSKKTRVKIKKEEHVKNQERGTCLRNNRPQEESEEIRIKAIQWTYTPVWSRRIQSSGKDFSGEKVNSMSWVA